MNARGIFAIAVLLVASTAISSELRGIHVPAPHGLVACKADDPLVAAEKRLATTMSADLLACFTIGGNATETATAANHSGPATYAIAMGLWGDEYEPKDMAVLLAQDRLKWRSAESGDKVLKDWVARLNAVSKESTLQQPPIDSMSSTMLSVESLDDRAYFTVSLRKYARTVDGQQTLSANIIGVAIVLQGKRVAHLEMVCELQKESDAWDLRTQIIDWARDVEAKVPESGETTRAESPGDVDRKR